MLSLFRRRGTTAGAAAIDRPGRIGIPWHSGAELLARPDRALLLRRLEQAVGIPDAHFRALYHDTLERFAAFVQQLPASESHHHARPGGLLDHSLDVAARAVAIRRGHLLPPGGDSGAAGADPAGDRGTEPGANTGADPGAASRLADRWTWAVFAAALLHDVGKAAVLVRVTRLDAAGRVLGPWVAWSGPMPATPFYRLQFVPHRRYPDHTLAAPFLARMLVPEAALAWAAGDPALMLPWLATLAGDADRGGVLAAIVIEADRLSVAADLGTAARAGAPAVATPAGPGRQPLPLRLVAALRRLVDEGELPLNRPGAAAWVHGDALWVVAKRGLDAMRERLLQDGFTDIPARNDRLMDILQQHGLCRVNADRAVWRVEVAMAGFEATLTVLRFPLARLWPLPDGRPQPMAGRITVIGAEGDAGEDAPGAEADAAPTDQRACAEDGAEPPIGVASALGTEDGEDGAGLPPAIETEVPKAEGLAVLTPAEPGAKTHDSDSASEDAIAADDAGPAEPEAFLAWLTDGIRECRLELNQVGALVHVVPEGLMLVSPRIFKVYAGTDPDRGRHWEYVQRRLLRKRWHRVHARGRGIFEYQVSGERKTSRLKGIVLTDPTTRLNLPMPEANRHLTRVTAL